MPRTSAFSRLDASLMRRCSSVGSESTTASAPSCAGARPPRLGDAGGDDGSIGAAQHAAARTQPGGAHRE